MLLAILLLDQDRFKDINDMLGHQGGDLLLKGVSARLVNRVRGADIVSRQRGQRDGLAGLLDVNSEH